MVLDTFGKDSMDSVTNALLIAAENERDDIIEYILQYNIDTSFVVEDGQYATHLKWRKVVAMHFIYAILLILAQKKQ